MWRLSPQRTNRLLKGGRRVFAIKKIPIEVQMKARLQGLLFLLGITFWTGMAQAQSRLIEMARFRWDGAVVGVFASSDDQIKVIAASAYENIDISLNPDDTAIRNWADTTQRLFRQGFQNRSHANSLSTRGRLWWERVPVEKYNWCNV
jgi:hypothetical protein